MSTFVCQNAGNQPWFGCNNSFRASCSKVPTGFGPGGCTTPPYPNGISSLNVDVKVYFWGYPFFNTVPPSIIGPITNISLFLFYEDLTIPITVYKSDPQTYSVPSNESLYQNGVAASQTNNSNIVGGPCIIGCSQGANNCRITFSRAYTKMIPIGVSKFNYTIYAIDCHNNGPTSEKYTFYILYDKCLDNGGNALDGFNISADGASLFADCNGTITLVGANNTGGGLFSAVCNHQVKVSAARVIL